MIQMPTVYQYLFSLFIAVFAGKTPPEKPENITWQAIFREAKRQNLFMFTYASIQHLQKKPEGEENNNWQLLHMELLAKSVNQSVEIEKLLHIFEEKNLRVLPLKGYFLRDMYPEREMREMSDFDLLVADDRSQEIRDIMSGLGYQLHSAVEHHAEYQKKPYVTIELHRKLLPDRVGRKAYYENIWSKCTPLDGSKTVCCIGVEDFLIFILLHFEKHYLTSGCGIRFLLDVHAILRTEGEHMNMEYFWAETEKAELTEFTKTVFNLERAVFADCTPTDSARHMLDRMIALGIFGTKAGYEMNRIERLTPKGGNVRIGKLRYYGKIVCPPFSEMREQFPTLRKVPVLLPVFWVWRGIKTIFCKPKNISKHYKRIMSYGEESASLKRTTTNHLAEKSADYLNYRK